MLRASEEGKQIFGSMYSYMSSMIAYVVVSSNKDIIEECGQGCKRTHYITSKYLQHHRDLHNADEHVCLFDFVQQ
jgi:hypothetical protein